jgi:WWE domain
MSDARTQELQARLKSISTIALKLSAECDSTDSPQEKQRNSSFVQWQWQSNEGWQNFGKTVNDMLKSAQTLSRGKLAFRANGVAYTADLIALVQKRQSVPHTQRAIRRIEAGVDIKIEFMLQLAEAIMHDLKQCEHQLMTHLLDAVVVIENSTVKQVKWECNTTNNMLSNWTPYSPDITAVLETGYAVSLMCSLQSHSCRCVSLCTQYIHELLKVSRCCWWS